MITDEIFMKTLGFPNTVTGEQAFRSLLQSGGGADINLPDELTKADGLPSVMESYVPGSQLYMLGLAKQRGVIRKFMPILQKKSETKTGELDAKDAFQPASNADLAR